MIKFAKYNKWKGLINNWGDSFVKRIWFEYCPIKWWYLSKILSFPEFNFHQNKRFYVWAWDILV